MKVATPIRQIMTMDFDNDPWGWGLRHWFGVACALYAERERLPVSWQFEPGGYPAPRSPDHVRENSDWPDTEYMILYEDHAVDGNDLIQAGEVLNRYLRRVQWAGRDY